MKIELTLLELNDLYVAVCDYNKKCKEQLNEFGKNVSSINYFKEQLNRSNKLVIKVHTELHNKVKELDEARDYVERVSRDYSAFKDYADSMNEARSEDRVLGNI